MEKNDPDAREEVPTLKAKYILLTAEIRQMCLQMRRSGRKKLPGEAELCNRYGVSRQTVRKALQQLEEAGEITRVRGSGTFLASDRPGERETVALIVPYTEEYIYPQLLRDVEAVLSSAGFDVKKYPSGNKVFREREILQKLLQNPPSGILMEGAKAALPSPNIDLLRMLEIKRVPIVFLHAPLPVPEKAPVVQDDNEGGAKLLVRRLLAQGHQKIAGIFKSDDQQGVERYQGYLSELLEAGQPVSEDWILWYSTEDRDRLINGQYNWLDHFIYTRIPECTAVVCYNDEIAYALIRTLSATGIRVPDEYAVVSFDNSHYCSLSPVSITSLGHERHQMGTTAARMLLRLMQGKQAASCRLSWVLQERKSG